MRWTGLSGAMLAIVLAMPPMSADASSVQIRPSDVSGVGLEIHYLAAPADSNDLSISRAGDDFTFREDPGVTISPSGSGCTSLGPLVARCSHPGGVGRVFVEFDNGNDCLVVVELDNTNDCLTVVDSATLPPPGESFPLKAFGGAGGDKLAGGAGNDDLQGGVGGDRLRGGEGNDRLDFPDSMSDEQGADVLEGGPGDDNLNGGPAGRPLEADVLSGEEGIDTADFSERTEPLTIDLDGEADDGEPGEHDNVQPGVECVIGGSNDDTLIGSSAAECLDGRDGEDTIEGRAGNDTLQGGVNDPSGDSLGGGSGNDTMRGGSGDDSLVGGEGDDHQLGEGGGDRVEGEDGNDQLQGGAGADTVDGGAGDDSVDGGAFLLIGGDGPDELFGGEGNDTLFGRRGNDRLDGGLGADDISGGSERDTVTYEDRTNRVFVTLDDLPNDGEAGERDNVRSDVEVVLGGMRGDDLSGDADRNKVEGARGEDYINGGRDEDQLLGGNAPDIVRAHDGEADDVACGDGVDLAIADGQDKVIECETVDRPGDRQPVVGRSARVLREGKFQLRLPEGRRFFRLNQDVKIPIESTIDPRAKAVGLVTANRTGARQVASVSAGRFTVRQGRRRPVTKLRLTGRLPDCRGSSTRRGRAKRAARPSARTLRVDVGGPVSAPRVSNRAGVSGKRRHKKRGRRVWRVIGENSDGTSDGTEWLTKDRCDGTLTKVISGTVHVRDFGLGRTCIVRAGESHLAARPEIGVATLHQGFRGERAYAPSRMSGLERGEDQRERSARRRKDGGCRAPREPSNSEFRTAPSVGDPSASRVGTMLTVEAPKCVASAKTEASLARAQRLRVSAGGGRAAGGCW